MAWVEQCSRNGKPMYRGRYRDGAGRTRVAGHHRLKTETLRMARAAEADSRARAGEHLATGQVTFAQYFCYHWLPQRRVEVNTRATYESYFRTALEPTFGDLLLHDITPRMVQTWVSAMTAAGVSPATVHGRVRALGTVLGARTGVSAVRDRLIRANPAQGVQLPHVPRREVSIFTPGEVDRLVAAMDPWWQPLCLLAAGTGLRWGEVVALEVGDFDPAITRLTVRRSIVETTKANTGNGTRFLPKPYPKTGRSRQVTISEDLSTAVHDCVLARGLQAEDRLFTMPGGTVPSRTFFGASVWRPALVRAAVPRLRFHDLRASHVSWLLAGGADLATVMARVGHTQFTTTQRYTTVLAGAEDRALAALRATRMRDATPTQSSPVADIIELGRHRVGAS